MPATQLAPEQGHDLLTATQVADRLSISVRTLYRLLARGALPRPVRYNRKLVRWKKCDIDHYVDSLTA
jgi:excisionase family DNA binding protein